MPPKIETIIAHLLKSSATPLVSRETEDGTIIVVAQSGKKFRFSPDQVQQARLELEQTKPPAQEVQNQNPGQPPADDARKPAPKPKPELSPSKPTPPKRQPKPPKPPSEPSTKP